MSIALGTIALFSGSTFAEKGDAPPIKVIFDAEMFLDHESASAKRLFHEWPVTTGAKIGEATRFSHLIVNEEQIIIPGQEAAPRPTGAPPAALSHLDRPRLTSLSQ